MISNIVLNTAADQAEGVARAAISTSGSQASRSRAVITGAIGWESRRRAISVAAIHVLSSADVILPLMRAAAVANSAGGRVTAPIRTDFRATTVSRAKVSVPMPRP